MWMKDEPNSRQQLILKGVYLRSKTESKTHDGAKQDRVEHTRLRL